MPADRTKLEVRPAGQDGAPRNAPGPTAGSRLDETGAAAECRKALTDDELRALGAAIGPPPGPGAGRPGERLDIRDLPQVTKALDALLKVMERLEDFAERHPDVFRDAPPPPGAGWLDPPWTGPSHPFI
jgi:hypothetical protein